MSESASHHRGTSKHSAEHLRPNGHDRAAPGNQGTSVHRGKWPFHRHFCGFGRAAAGFWGEQKTAAHLADEAGISERNANQMLSGQRKVSANVLVAFCRALIGK